MSAFAEKKRASSRCRECGDEVGSRVRFVTPATRLPHGKRLKLLLGAYCCSDCLLDAIGRGIPKYK